MNHNANWVKGIDLYCNVSNNLWTAYETFCSILLLRDIVSN